MYYSVDGRYECAPVVDRQTAATRSRYPLASLLVVIDDHNALPSPTIIDPLVADFVFNHASCNRLRIGVHGALLTQYPLR